MGKNNQIVAIKPPEPLELSSFSGLLDTADDVVSKQYLTRLKDMNVLSPSEEQNEAVFAIKERVRLLKLNKMVYAKDENALYKLTSVINSVSNENCALFVILDSNGKETDFYIGIHMLGTDSRDTSVVYDCLKNSLAGQFPGVSTKVIRNPEMIKLSEKIQKGKDSVSIVSCVADQRDNELKDNSNFVQGLEKLALSMNGKSYTAVVIANTASKGDIKALRGMYESFYTALSPFAAEQLNYGINESLSLAEGVSVSLALSESKTHTEADTNGETETDGTAKMIGATATVGGDIGPVRASGSVTTAKTDMHSESTMHSTTVSNAVTKGKTATGGIQNTKTAQIGKSKASTVTIENKRIKCILDRIDRQLERIDEFESLGLWQCAAYFLSDDSSTAEIAASTYLSIMRGEKTGVEISALNTWYRDTDGDKIDSMTAYIGNFAHPKFYSENKNELIDAANYVSGKELAVHMGLPRHSVCGLPVVEHAEFAKEVFKYDRNTDTDSIRLGSIFDMGQKTEGEVSLDIKSLAMHTFVTGSTGSGKSNTVYNILDKLDKNGVRFMVVEPAKGEYKDVFGSRNDVTVFGTNKKVFSDILSINPFKFPKDSCHVYEHIDRLVEIFDVCWPMYAAMPAVLKAAIINAYKKCGWNLDDSTSEYNLFPTFTDLLTEISAVIEGSAYSAETKGNYIGSLVTRVQSLTNGINGQIFSSNEVDNELLFDSNVIVDISRIGSAETKALIMGILVMRLNEYRVDKASEANTGLKHVTVLEEAHNILRRTSTEQNPDAPSVAGKSVEMISNAIAEMRTYGEGFIIADQSPTSVDISAVKNTNTKIIMRLPEANDRELAGKAAGLKEEQFDEIAKLPLGVAVVYQNNWVEPALCAIDRFESNGSGKYVYEAPELSSDSKKFKTEIIKMALSYKHKDKYEYDKEFIRENVDNVELSAKARIAAYKLIEDEEKRNDKKFIDICDFVNAFVSNGESLDRMIATSTERRINDELIDLVSPQIEDESLLTDINLCILYRYAFENPEAVNKYNEWRRLKTGGLI